jgi:hypothetical protein
MKRSIVRVHECELTFDVCYLSSEKKISNHAEEARKRSWGIARKKL